MNILSNYFKFKNANREEIYKILINIDPNKTNAIDEISGRFLKIEWNYWQIHCVKLSTFS